MIIEMRTYTLKPGTLAEAEKRFGEALPIREKYSKLAAFFHSEIGPLNQIIHIFNPAPFCPPLTPRNIGPLFEIRQYTLVAGAIPGLIERWSEKIAGRQTFSPLVAGMYTEFGALNKWVHIWAYKDAAERFAVRAAASAGGQWPARNPPGVVVKQETQIVVAAPFSPIR